MTSAFEELPSHCIELISLYCGYISTVYLSRTSKYMYGALQNWIAGASSIMTKLDEFGETHCEDASGALKLITIAYDARVISLLKYDVAVCTYIKDILHYINERSGENVRFYYYINISTEICNLWCEAFTRSQACLHEYNQ